jgi:hypothetical protein
MLEKKTANARLGGARIAWLIVDELFRVPLPLREIVVPGKNADRPTVKLCFIARRHYRE